MDRRKLLLLLNRMPGWMLSGASLDLDFANQRYFVQSQGNSLGPATFTRSSGAYERDSVVGGNYNLFASGLPRITGQVGYLSEQSRTNSINNNSMQGAGTPATFPTNWTEQTDSFTGYSANVIGTGTENGIDYMDVRVHGTPSSGTYFAINAMPKGVISASQGQTWTHSVFLKLVAGSFANITNMKLGWQEFNGSGTFTSNTQNTVTSFPTGSALSSQRYVASLAIFAPGTTNIMPWLSFTLSTGNPIEFTVRIGWPQLELGSYATSPIRTTNATATRAADVLALPSLTGWYGQDQTGTLFVKGYISTLNSEADTLVNLRAGNSTTGTRLIIQADNSVSLFDSIAGNVSPGTPSAASMFRFAAAFAPGAQSACLNGGSIVTGSAASLATGISAIDIGNLNGTKQPANSLYEVAYWPTRQSDAFLQYITANR